MTRTIVFEDLGGRIDNQSGKATSKPLSKADDRWLTALVAEVDAAAYTFPLSPQRGSHRDENQPLLTRQQDGTWRAGRFIGEIRRDDRILEIRPRLSFPIITAWASAALNLTLVPQSAGRSGISYMIAEMQAATWRRALTNASRHGLPGLRAELHHRGPMVRGHLDVKGTIGLRARRSPDLASVSKPKVVDNPVTRAIVLADRVLDRKLHRKGWRGTRLDELIPHLRAATGPRPALPNRRELDSVRYTPITQQYRAAADLSWLIAKYRAPGGDASSDTHDGVLLDVAELWELFLLQCLRRAVPNRTVVHGTTNDATALLTSSLDPTKSMGKLYPDFVIRDNGNSSHILDAKYKRLQDPFPVVREDLYQLTTYLSGFGNETERSVGMLLYPQLDTAPSTAETLGPWQIAGGARIHFARLPVDESACVKALTAMLTEPASGAKSVSIAL